MGNMCSPKSQLVCGHISGLAVFATIMTIYGINKFIGDGDNVAIKDDGCNVYGGLKGPTDITPVGPNTALIASADRENWLLHENIE
jgi:hypothetical protein